METDCCKLTKIAHNLWSALIRKIYSRIKMSTHWFLDNYLLPIIFMNYQICASHLVKTTIKIIKTIKRTRMKSK